MRVQILQHLGVEDIGAMRPWFEARGAVLAYTRFFEPDAQLPSLDGLDLIVAMGGPMSVNDEDSLPWLVAEKAFLRDAIAAGIPVLGVCLGAQLIASALGAAVRPGAHQEIGWFPVRARPVAGEGVFAFPPQIELIHWHGETFDLPEGARLLASSEACAHQAFQLGRRVIGLQCHPEMTAEEVVELLEDCGHQLPEGPWVQSPEALLAVGPERYQAGHALIARILSFLTD